MNYDRWKGNLPTEFVMDDDPEAALRDLYAAVSDMGRILDMFMRRNDDVFADSSSLGDKMRETFDLDLDVEEGHVVYIDGGRAYKADISDHAKRPMGVVESVTGKSAGQRQGVIWFGQGTVDMATPDTSITPGGYLYLSTTSGNVSATPPEMDGTSTDYTAPVGWSVADVSDGFVKAVFNPQMIVRLIV